MEHRLSISSLRGIAALFIVLYHTRIFLNATYPKLMLGRELFESGYFGVDLFFIISGFVIVYSTQQKERLAPIKFVIKRFFRIFPVYLLVLIVYYFVCAGDRFGLKELAENVFFIHSNYARRPPFFGYNMMYQMWPMAFELLFYVVFLVSMTAAHRWRAYVCSVAIAGCTVGLQLAFNGQFDPSGYVSISAKNGAHWGVLHILGCSLMLEFVVGMLICEAYLFLRRRSVRLDHSVLKALCYAAIAYFILCYSSQFNPGHGVLKIGSACIGLFVAALVLEGLGVKLSSSIMLFFGEISYSLFVGHVFIIVFLKKYGGQLPFYHHTVGFSRVALVVGLAILLAFFLHKFVEKPMMALSKKLCAKLN